MTTSRETEVQITHEFTGGTTPVWTSAAVYTLPTGTSDLMIPVLGDTQYAVRTRVQDVYGNFSTWSTHTTHTTAAGPDGIGVENRVASVTIDENGITIRDGALILEDEYGHTVMTATGFGGSWSQFLATSLYNSNFAVGASGAVANGRTSDLPYWTVAKPTGSPTITRGTNTSFASGYAVKVAFAALANKASFLSDKIDVVAGQYYGVAAALRAVVNAGTSTIVEAVLHWYDSAGSQISTSTLGLRSWAGSYSATFEQSIGAAIAPVNADTMAVEVTVEPFSAYTAGDYVEIGQVATGPAAVALNGDGFYSVAGLTASSGVTTGTLVVNNSISLGVNPSIESVTANRNDWSPTDIDLYPVIAAEPTAVRNITGIDAWWAYEGSVLYLFNDSTSNNLVLKHNDAGSTTTNRFYCPNLADVTIRPGGAVMLMYRANPLQRWRVIAP